MAQPPNSNHNINNGLNRNNNDEFYNPSAARRALGITEILNIVLEHLDRRDRHQAACVSHSWLYHCARLYWRDPPPDIYRDKPARVVRAYRGAVRTLYVPPNPNDLAFWSFPGVRLAQLPYDYVRRADAVRSLLDRCGGRLHTLIFDPEGLPPVEMRFISFPQVTEADFDFYGNDVQMFAVPEQEPNEMEEEWGDMDEDAVPVDPEQLDDAAPPENGAKQVNEEQVAEGWLRPYNDLHVDVLPQLAVRRSLENIDIEAPTVREECLLQILDYEQTIREWLAEQPLVHPLQPWLPPPPQLPLFANLHRINLRLFTPAARLLPRILAAAPLIELVLELLGPADAAPALRAIAETLPQLRALAVNLRDGHLPFRAAQPLQALHNLRALALVSRFHPFTAAPSFGHPHLHPAEPEDSQDHEYGNAAANTPAALAAVEAAAMAEANDEAAAVAENFFGTTAPAHAELVAAAIGPPALLDAGDARVPDADWEPFVAQLPELRHLTVRVASRLSHFAYNYAGRACRRLRTLDLHASIFLWGEPTEWDSAPLTFPRPPLLPPSRPPTATSASAANSSRGHARHPSRDHPHPLRSHPVAPVPFPRLRHLRMVALAPVVDLREPNPAAPQQQQPQPQQHHQVEGDGAPAAAPENAAGVPTKRPAQYADPYRVMRIVSRLRNGAPRLRRIMFRGSGNEDDYPLERSVINHFETLVRGGRSGNGDNEEDDDDNLWQ